MGDEPHPEWIEKAVKLAAALGANPTRVRWKLIRWVEHRRRDRRRLDQKLDHIRYEHKTCSDCGAVQDRDAKVCSHCGVKLYGRGFHVLRRIGLATPQAFSMSTLLALVIMAAYARVFIAQGGGFGSPPAWLLYDFGAQWPIGSDEPWRLVTPMFLHIGLWHLAFNLIAIATVGPQIEAVYGRLTMLFVFIATGVLANIASGQIQPEVLSAGASGGLCGLIGAAAGYGHRLGTGGGRALRNDMLKWIAYTIIFGFAVHANNWAHAFGALSGAVFGYTIPPRVWTRRALLPLRVIGKLFGVVATVGALAIILTRTPQDPRTGDDGAAVFEVYRFAFETCRVADLSIEGAQAIADARHVLLGSSDTLIKRSVGEMCLGMLLFRDACSAGKYNRTICEVVERAAATRP